MRMQAMVKDAHKERTERRIGQILAFAIGVILASLGTYSAIHGAQWAGGFIGCSGISGIVVAFLTQGKQGTSQQPTKSEAEAASKKEKQAST